MIRLIKGRNLKEKSLLKRKKFIDGRYF